MMTSDLKVKIGDFGLASLANQKANQFGTIPYMAPELFNNEKPELSVDIYSLGIVFWELANYIQCGTYLAPYKSENHSTLLMRVSLKELRPETDSLPPSIQTLLGNLWSPLKNLRYTHIFRFFFSHYFHPKGQLLVQP